MIDLITVAIVNFW